MLEARLAYDDVRWIREGATLPEPVTSAINALGSEAKWVPVVKGPGGRQLFRDINWRQEEVSLQESYVRVFDVGQLTIAPGAERDGDMAYSPKVKVDEMARLGGFEDVSGSYRRDASFHWE